MKTILIATDLSARSDRALDRALMLAGEHHARLAVLHVVDSRLPQAAIDRQTNEAPDAIRAYLAARGAGQDAAVCVTVGEADRDILRQAAQRDADLIVLGAHRVAPGDDTFRESTAWNVLRGARQPVLLVKEAALAPYRRVMVGFDFSGCSEAALRLAFAFRPKAVDAVHVYHVPFEGFQFGTETDRQVREEREADLADAVATALAALPPEAPAGDVELRRLVCRGEALGGLREECANLRPDLLAIGTHGRTGLAHAIFGSVAEDLLRNPPCDVVALRSGA